MLGLPESVPDQDLIAALAQIVANLQQKYEALLQDTVALEDKVANRDAEDFKDVVPADAREFWMAQLLANRDAALAVLGGLRTVQATLAVAPASPIALGARCGSRPIAPWRRGRDKTRTAGRRFMLAAGRCPGAGLRGHGGSV